MAAALEGTPEKGTRAAEPRLLGVLTVVVIRAKNLPDKSIVGKQSPYVTFKYGEEKRKTKVKVKGGQHPVFDEEVRFNIYEDAEDILKRSRADNSSPSINASDLPLTASTSSASNASFTNSISSSTSMNSSVSAASSSAKGNGIGGGKGFRRNPIKKSMMCSILADDSKEPRLVGETVVDLGKVLKECEHDGWYTLMYKDRYAGEVSLELTYFINSAPPIPKKVAKPVLRPDYGGPGTFHPSNSTNSLPTREPRRHLASTSMANLRPRSTGSLGGVSGMSASQSYSHAPGASHRMSVGDVPSNGSMEAWAMQRQGGYGSSGGGNLGVIDEMGGRAPPRRGSFAGATHIYGTNVTQPPSAGYPNPYDSQSLHESMSQLSMSSTASHQDQFQQPAAYTVSPPPAGDHPPNHRHSLPGPAPHMPQWGASGSHTADYPGQEGTYETSHQTPVPSYAPPTLPQFPRARPASQYIPPSTSFPQLAQSTSAPYYSPPPPSHASPSPVPLAQPYPQTGPAEAPADVSTAYPAYNMPGAYPTSRTPIPTSSFPQLSGQGTPLDPSPPPSTGSYPTAYPNFPPPMPSYPGSDYGERSRTPLPLVDNRPPMHGNYLAGPPPTASARTRPPSTGPAYYPQQYLDPQQTDRPLPLPIPAPGPGPGLYGNVPVTRPLAGYAAPSQVPYEDAYVGQGSVQGGRGTPLPYYNQVSQVPSTQPPVSQYPPYNPPPHPGQSHTESHYPPQPNVGYSQQSAGRYPPTNMTEADPGYRRPSAGMSYLANLGVGAGSIDPQPAYNGQPSSQPVPPPPSGPMYPNHYPQEPTSWAGQQQNQQAERGGAGGWHELPPPLPPSLAGRGDWR